MRVSKFRSDHRSKIPALRDR